MTTQPIMKRLKNVYILTIISALTNIKDCHDILVSLFSYLSTISNKVIQMTTMNSIMIADGYGGKFKLWNVMYANGGNCSVT